MDKGKADVICGWSLLPLQAVAEAHVVEDDGAHACWNLSVSKGRVVTFVMGGYLNTMTMSDLKKAQGSVPVPITLEKLAADRSKHAA